MAVSEPLIRAALGDSFGLPASIAFPLTLEVHSCDMVSLAAQPASLFISLYSPARGASWSELLTNWLLWPWLLAMLFCCTKALKLEQHWFVRAIVVLGGTAALQQLVAWYMTGHNK